MSQAQQNQQNDTCQVMTKNSLLICSLIRLHSMKKAFGPWLSKECPAKTLISLHWLI